MTSAVREPAMDRRRGGEGNPQQRDREEHDHHALQHSHVREADDSEHLEDAVARQPERAEHGEHAREHDAQWRCADLLRGRCGLQILHGHVGRPLERHAAAHHVAALQRGGFQLAVHR
jgi:hypothetical protein